MKTTDLFKINKQASRLNESLSKTFGQKLNLENFDLHQLQDARNKIRTQLSQIKSDSGFNENLENDAYHKAQFMLDTLNAEIMEREEFVAEVTEEDSVEESGLQYHTGVNKHGKEYMDKAAEAGRKGASQKELGALKDKYSKAYKESAVALPDISGLGPDAQSLILKLRRDVEEKRLQPTRQAVLSAASELAGDMDFAPELLLRQVLGKSVAEDSVAEGSAHGYNVVKWYEKWNDQSKLVKWLRKEAGIPKDDDIYFDDADLVYGDQTIVRDALVDPNLKFIDLLNAVAQASGGRTKQKFQGVYRDRGVEEEAPPTAKGERMVKHIKQGYADDGKLTDKEKGIAYATAWKQHNKEKNEDVQTEQDAETVDDFLKRGGQIQYGKSQKGPRRSGTSMASRHIGGSGDRMKASRTGLGANTQGRPVTGISKKTSESNETGENMTKLIEGEIQQASAIVTAKTMVDRVGRWIEELSGMENDTLLQLGDSIRDEMGQEQAKAFIQAVAPAIQQALDTLKGTRDTLSTGVRSLASGEQPADMLGAEPGADMAAPAEPDAMNAEPGADMDAEPAADDFAAAEPAAGGIGDAGREQRESIDRQSRLLKVLAG